MPLVLDTASLASSASRAAIRPAVIAVVAVCFLADASASRAESDARTFPHFDVSAMCHARANYAFAATLGQADADEEFTLCTVREVKMRDLAQTIWATSSERARADCGDLARGTYGMLARCLDPSIPAR